MVSQSPLVSVVISTYNHEKYIQQSVRSVLSQQIDDIEVIVLDDCSPDSTTEALGEIIDDNRVKYIRHPFNLGLNKNNDLALKSGTGKYSVWLHGDDVLLPGHLQSSIDALECYPECVLAYSPCRWIDENNQAISKPRHPGHLPVSYAGGRNEIAALLVYDNYITPSSAVFRREALNKIGTLNPDISGPDWDLFLRLAMHKMEFAFVNEESTAYRIHGGQDSNSFYASIEPLKTHIHVLSMVLNSDSKDCLCGYETLISEHLLRRLGVYDKESVTPYAPALNSLIDGLKQLNIRKHRTKKSRPIDRGHPLCTADIQLTPVASEVPDFLELQEVDHLSPLVSVILTTYNRPAMLRDAIKSVLQQDYKKFELIVVNDAGEDVGTIINEYNCNKQISYLNLGKNAGISAARNKALSIAQGEIIAYLDDDDTYLPNHLSVITNKLADRSIEFVYTGSVEISESLDGNRRVELQRSQPYAGIVYTKERLHIGNFIPVNTWGHRKSLLDRIGTFDESLSSLEDWDFLIKASRETKIVQIDTVTAEVHVRPNVVDNLTAKDKSKNGQLYRLIYNRYDDLGNSEISALRADVLNGFDADNSTDQGSCTSENRQIQARTSNVKPGRELRVALLSVDDIDYACINLRVLSPARSNGNKVKVRLGLIQGDQNQGAIDHQVIQWADLVIVQRGFPMSATMPLLDSVFRSTKPVIYEMDDLLGSAIPASNPCRGEFIQKQPYIEEVIRKSDLVTVSCEPLRNEIVKFGTECRILPNLIDEAQWPAQIPGEASNPITIGYAGSSTHDDDLLMIEEALVRIAEKHSDNVRFIFMGDATDKIKALPDFELRPFVKYSEFPEAFQAMGADIAIAPLCDIKFNRCKSHLKWLEYSISGIAGVYSDIPTYNLSVDHRKTGLLVNNDVDEWFNALDELIRNPELRRKIVVNAQREVLTKYTMEVRAKDYLNVWSSVIGRKIDLTASNTGHSLSPSNIQYQKWQDITRLSEGQAQLMAERMVSQWQSKPSFHILMMVNPGEQALIADTLDSLSDQLYSGWGLSIISNAPMPEVLSGGTDNIEWIYEVDQPWNALHKTINETGADWVMFINPGDSFSENALFSLADYANICPGWSMMYCDEDTRNSAGYFIDPKFKPDANVEFLRSTNYVGNACAIRRTTLLDLGGFNNLAYVYWQDLAFKVTETLGETALGHVPLLLFHAEEHGHTQCNSELRNDNERVIRYEHFLRTGISAELATGLKPNCYHVIYKHTNKPLISIIIPTKDRADLIMPCIDTLLDKTAYINYEVLIIDNGSIVDDVHDYYADLRTKYSERIRIIPFNQAFNFSAMNNIAAKQARGEYLLLLNNDTEVIHKNWLDAMMNHAQRPDVGIVGARLIYTDKKLQHAGVVLGVGGIAAHAHYQQPMDQETPLLESFVDRNVSALTGACLLVRKEIYDQVGGLDDDQLKIAYNDVDLCLKVLELGYRIVWTPFATLIHHDSSSRSKNGKRDESTERFTAEMNKMWARWLNKLTLDPAYNRNLSLSSPKSDVELDFIPSWNLDFHDRPRVLGFPLDGLGCGYYRVYAPLWALENHAKAEIAFVSEHDKSDFPRIPTVTEIARLSPDTLLLQSTLKDNQLETLKQYKEFNSVFKVFDLDDLKTNLPDSNSRKKSMYKDMKYRLRRALGLCDRLVVSTEPLKTAYGQWIDDVVVVPNRLQKSRWLANEVVLNDQDKPRVGWAGAQQHHGDLRILIDVVKATYKEIDWIFFGMCLDELRPYIAEEHPFVSPNDYPVKLASLKLDLAVAPLEQNPFNEAKSNLRLLEFGIMGWPVVCSDIYPYQDAPVTTVREKSSEWVDAIMDKVSKRDVTRLEGQRLKKWVVENWMLEDHLDEWLAALSPNNLTQEIQKSATN